MRGLIWAAGVWFVAAVFLGPVGPKGFLRRGTFRLTRVQIATILALLGTHTFAATAAAEDVLANPLVVERMVRGVLSAGAVLVIGPLVFRRMTKPTIRNPRATTAIGLYLLVAAVSTLYSAAPVPTAAKFLELAVGFVIVLTIVIGPDAQAELRRMVRFVVSLEAALVAGAILGFFLLPGVFAISASRPGFLLDQTMSPPYAHSNALSASGALVASYAFAVFLTAENRRERVRWGVLSGIGTMGLLLASGRQGVLIWLAAVTVLLFVHRRTLFTLVVTPAAAAILALNWDTLWSVLTRGQGMGQIESLSGRLAFWESAIEAWWQQPMTGYGFGAGGRFVALARIGSSQVSHLHNGYLEALVGVGLLGVIPLAYAVYRTARWALRCLRNRVSTPEAILVIPILIHTAFSLGFGGWLKADFMILAALVGLADWELRRKTHPPRLSAAARAAG